MSQAKEKDNMNKAIATLMTVICLAFFTGSIISEAAVGDSYCGQCGTALVIHGEHITTWYETHSFTIHYSDKTSKTEQCTITHTINRIYHACPNGHNVTWYEDVPSNSHSNPKCPG